MFGICLPSALSLFMRELDDCDSLAVVGVEVLVRNVARHRPRQFVHAIGARDIFVAHAGLQPRAEYGHDHGLLLYELCFSYLGRSAIFVTHTAAPSATRFGALARTDRAGAKSGREEYTLAGRRRRKLSKKGASRNCRKRPGLAEYRCPPSFLHKCWAYR